MNRLRLLCNRPILAATFAAASLAFVPTALLHGQSTPLPPGTTVPDSQPGNEAAGPSAPSSAREPLTAAESQIEAKNFDAAHSLLTTYLSAHPGDARALFDLGYIEDAQGHTEPAAAAYRKAIAADPRQFESRLALGLILARQGQQQPAREQLEAAVQLEPNPPSPAAKAQAWRMLARLLRNSDPDAAKQALLKALSLTPETPDDTLLTAEIAEASGDTETAEAAYRAVLRAQPSSSAAVAGLTHLLLQQKKYSDAEPLLRAALDRDPDDPALNSQLATALAAEGKQADAVALIEKLHQLQPANPAITRMLANTYFDSKLPDKAEPLYSELLKTSPDDPALLAAEGETLVRLGRYTAAIPVLRHAAQVKPDDGDAWGGLAFAASQTHDYSATLQALSMRAKYLPETPATYFLWATAYDTLHQTKPAAEYYRKFLSSAHGKFPDQEWQAQHRLLALGKSR